MRHNVRYSTAAVPIATVPITVLAALATFSLLFAGISGCKKPELPPVAYCGPTLASADLGLSQVNCSPNGYVILEKKRSRGRFPAALAVARLVPSDPFDVVGSSSASSSTSWQVATVPQEEAVPWNALFNTVPGVREVIVLDQASVVQPNGCLDGILKSVKRLEAAFCLVFGPRTAEIDGAGFAGVLLDVETGQPVAYVQAEATPDDFELPRTDRSEYDQRHNDVNYLAARKFQRQLLACMLEFIERDLPIVTTQPSRWQEATTKPAPIYIVPNQSVGW